MKSHANAIHKGVRYSCDQCDFKAAYINYLKKHLKSVHPKGKKYKSDQSFFKDIQLPYRCNHCDYSTSLLPNLKKHIKAIHQKEKKVHLKDPLQFLRDGVFKDSDIATGSRPAEKLKMMNTSILIKEETIDSKEDVLVSEDTDLATGSGTAEDELQMMNSSVTIKETIDKEDVNVWAVSGIH